MYLIENLKRSEAFPLIQPIRANERHEMSLTRDKTKKKFKFITNKPMCDVHKLTLFN